MEKIWEIKDPDSYLPGRRTKRREGPSPRDEKDPAWAYSLSMFYWGGGQFYNDEIGKGTTFLIAAVLLLAAMVLSVIYRTEALQFLRARGISSSGTFLGAEIVLFVVLFFWAYNAADAYQRSARSRRTPFRGVNSRVTPVLGSLIVPGWGQFLNGQPLKGSVFSALAVIAVFALLSVSLTFIVWPVLEASDTRFIVEGISAVSLLLIPFMPLLWAFSAYDALKVSLDELKKEPLRERLKAAYYRGRTQGWVRGVFPQIRGTFLLVLLLTFFVIVVYFWFPGEYYVRLLAWARSMLIDRGMTIVPALIERLLALMAGRGI